MNDDDNLLTLLNKCAERQDENFVTEAFAHLLRHLLKNAPEAAGRVLGKLTNGLLELTADEIRTVEVTTQATTEAGTPDMEIRVPPRFLVYVEVKVGSPKDEDQLERYLDHLKGSGVEQTRLVFLTRFPEDVGELAADPKFCRARWNDVAAWLRDANAPADDAVSAFLTTQFASFLRKKGMTVEQVSRDLVAGLPALRSLLLLVGEVLRQCALRTRLATSLEEGYIGFYCESQKYWVGVYFAKPQLLCFATQPGFRLAEDALRREGIGGEFEDLWTGGKKWTRSLDLSADRDKFFGLSASEQAQELKDFIERCLTTAKQIEAPA